ncbi:MAG: hypothetical protein QOH05_1351, partial [Acetobacteraceae bacterium]|nr:hypothetical protein [Acetobacteraceae bacterium]
MEFFARRNPPAILLKRGRRRLIY